jgi:hypothetical protein
LLGSKKVADGRGKEVAGRLGVGPLCVGNIDDGIDSQESVDQTFASGYVDAACPRNYDGLMSCPPQRFHGVATDNACTANHSNARC